MLRPPNTANTSPYIPPVDPIAPLRAALRGHYDIEREIGQGAFATVYLARDLKHERKVAIKVLNADPASDTGELRFIREIRLLAKLQHPNILPLHDSGHVEALLYYVMPFVSGETVRTRIDRERQLSVDTACSIAREVADALAYAHRQGIIHRDIKPENILLSTGHPILADFGIARAIDLAGVRQLTRTGAGSPGTPTYMSPEQLLGDREIDGRSDIYSLGCVLYEMLAGKPPFAGKDGFVKRFTEPPPSVLTSRRDVPPWVDSALSTALARNPDDRYSTSAGFMEALCAEPTVASTAARRPVVNPRKIEPPSAIRPSDSAPGVRRLTTGSREYIQNGARRWLVLAVGIIALVAVASRFAPAGWRQELRRRPPLDQTRIAVLPFINDSGPAYRSGTTTGLHTALERWDGLNVVPQEDVMSVIAQIGRSPGTTAEAADLARRLGAGWFVWGRARTGTNGGRAQLFEASSGRNVRTVNLASADLDAAGFAGAALQLLKASDRPLAADGGDGNTNSYAAWIAYGKGHTSLARWDLGSAENEFRAAIAADPRYAPPRVWLAQLLSWQRRDLPNEWGSQISEGMRFKNSLSSRDLAIATALAALNQNLYPLACDTYARLTRSDSLDFAGWYGLAECQSRDTLVLPYPASPSHWRFRSSFYAAAVNYIRAVAIDPGAHAILPFERLKTLLPTSATQIRTGRTADRQLFVAYPSLVGDTIAFVPYTATQFATLRPEQVGLRQPALDLASDKLLDFTSDWTARSPASSSAFAALADVLETRGQIATEAGQGLSALDATRKAESLATTPQQRLPLAIRVVWLRFKLDDFARAHALADSILSVAPSSNREEATGLIGLAALTGKIGRTSELADITSAFVTSDLATPVPTRAAAASFFAFAALGVCSDTIRVLEARLDESISSYVAESEQGQMRQDLKDRPLSMLVPCTNGMSVLRAGTRADMLADIQRAYAKHDSRRLKDLIHAVSAAARSERAGDLSLDYIYQLAWIRVASGDTAGAITQLDRVLGALPSIDRWSLREPAAAAAAVRAMALRADLAHALGDDQTAARWGRAVSSLWATADAPLQPVVNRMHALSSPGKR